MHEGISKALNLPPGMPTNRYYPPPAVEIDKTTPELPLVDGDTPKDAQVQEMWTARVRVFDLSDPTDAKDYERIWQEVCDGHARMAEYQTHFIPEKCKFVALLRWVSLRYKVPASGAQR